MTIKLTYEQLRGLQSLHERNLNNWREGQKAFIESTGAEPNSFGLLPDDVRMSQEYRYFRGQIEECKDKLKAVNNLLNQHFKAQYRADLKAEIEARRQAKLNKPHDG